MLKSQRGNAMIEMIPVLAIFVLLVNFSLGFFGIIHTGILNSIAARNYAFETFRNRSSLVYLRDTPTTALNFTYTNNQMRFHGIVSESKNTTEDFIATRRPARFSEISSAEELGAGQHNKIKGIAEGKKASDVLGEDRETGVNPVWVRTLYGICLTAACGGT
jgi:hypothetical protein